MASNLPAFTHTVTERFLRYAVIDTQSDPASATCPSTEKQKDLGRLLVRELKAIPRLRELALSAEPSMAVRLEAARALAELRPAGTEQGRQHQATRGVVAQEAGHRTVCDHSLDCRRQCK